MFLDAAAGGGGDVSGKGIGIRMSIGLGNHAGMTHCGLHTLTPGTVFQTVGRFCRKSEHYSSLGHLGGCEAEALQPRLLGPSPPA